MGARKILTFVIGCVTLMATAGQRFGISPDDNNLYVRIVVRSFPEIGPRSLESVPRSPVNSATGQRFHIDRDVPQWDTQNRQMDGTERGRAPAIARPRTPTIRTGADPDVALPTETGNPQRAESDGSGNSAGNADATAGAYDPPNARFGARPGADTGRITVTSTTTTATPTRQPAATNPSEVFSTNLLDVVRPYARDRNMVYSPISLQMLLGLFYIGARGQTKKELLQGGVLPSDQQQTGPIFKSLLDEQQNTPYAQLTFATIVLYNRDLVTVKNRFKNDAMKYFQAQIQDGDFNQPAALANNINAWVSDKTEGLIKNLLGSSAVDAQTQAMAITVVYYKAKWAKEFSKMDTATAKFKVDSKTETDVQMMYNDDTYNYADLPHLKAKAIELPYKDSDISMMIILPNDANGLQELEQNLGRVNLNQIESQMKMDTVTVRIPKFQISFEVDLEQPLRQLNIQRIFGGDSELSGMFDQKVKISKIQQKAVITVNEAGSEAAASSYAKFVPLSLPVKVNEFTADHPFVFAIRSPQAVLVIGHVINPNT